MRIAHVTATFPPYYAGTGLVCYHQAEGLARLGHQVAVFTAACSSGDSPHPEGVSVHRLPALFRIGNAPFLPGLLGLRDFDVIHLHYPFIFGAEMIRVVSAIRHIPYVLSHHNDLIGDGGRRYLFDAYTALFAPFVFRGARKWLPVSIDYAASCRIARLFRRRWTDVVEIPNGVDTDFFRPDVDGRPVRCRLGIPERARVLLFVGALDRAHHFKGAGYFLRAFAQMDGDIWLVLVGDGDLRPSLENLAEKLGVAPRVRFVGTVPHRDLPPFYAASDLVVLPSFPPESFGIVLIEAMACGRPVLTHDIPGVRSVVSDGTDGLLARPGDMDDLLEKVGALLDDPQRRRMMGLRGRAKVEEQYTWPRIVHRLLEVYQEVIR